MIKIMKRKILKIFLFGFLAVIFLFLAFFLINRRVDKKSDGKIFDSAELLPERTDAVLILGAGAKGGVMSDILKDRTDAALEVYKQGKAEKILVSGDHGRQDYDEVNVVKDYLLKNGVQESDIFLDHAGFDTYDSLYRAKNIFGVKTLVISTQDFHLPRAVYIANALGMEAVGIRADKRPYMYTEYLQKREKIAKVKAFFDILFKSKSKYGGPEIDIQGDGRESWD